jgi:mannose-1-phosphate guanylyltransferase
MKRVAVIMAGGAGERFWPLSRQRYPKQLLKIAGNRSMLRAALERIRPLVAPEHTFIITGRHLKPAIEEAARELPPNNVIGEPEGKNTAACLALACAAVKARFAEEADTVMVVLTADHFIRDTQAYAQDCSQAIVYAERQDALVTFGIAPDRPETGYGYIELGEPIEGFTNLYRVARFREKPDPETARQFMQSGRHLWNSGMFVWRTSVLVQAFRKYLPRMFEQLAPMADALKTGSAEELAAVFEPLEKTSIDVGVMEKADNVAVVKANFDWDDIGTWGSLARLLPRDANGNVLFGNAIALKSENSIVYSTAGAECGEGPIVVGLGLKDMIVVHTPDAILVLPANETQHVKDVVAYLRQHGMTQYL